MSTEQTRQNATPPSPERLGSALLSAEPNRCGSCASFRRLEWHDSIVKGGGWQLGGLCQTLALALEGENSGISSNGVYVMQSFGCMYWKQNTGSHRPSEPEANEGSVADWLEDFF